QAVGFVGLAFKNARKGQQLVLLFFLSGHDGPSFPSGRSVRLLFVEGGPPPGGQAEHLFQPRAVAAGQGLPQLAQRFVKLVDLGDQVFAVPQKQLGPHGLVDPGDSGQVAERVAGVLAQGAVVVGAHQADRNGVAQLADIADHPVVLGGGQGGDVLKAQHLGQLGDPDDGPGGVLGGGGDDKVGGGEVDLRRVLDAGGLDRKSVV